MDEHLFFNSLAYSSLASDSFFLELTQNSSILLGKILVFM